MKELLMRYNVTITMIWAALLTLLLAACVPATPSLTSETPILTATVQATAAPTIAETALSTVALIPSPTRIQTQLPASTSEANLPAYTFRVKDNITDLRMRDGTTYAIVGHLAQGDRDACWEEADAIAGRSPLTGGWCKISPPGSNTWVAASYLDILQDNRFDKETD